MPLSLDTAPNVPQTSPEDRERLKRPIRGDASGVEMPAGGLDHVLAGGDGTESMSFQACTTGFLTTC